MNPGVKLTLDVAQLVMLGGLVWGLAKMSASVTQLRDVTESLTQGLKDMGHMLTGALERISYLEGRGGA